jgi:hypothetical protein
MQQQIPIAPPSLEESGPRETYYIDLAKRGFGAGFGLKEPPTGYPPRDFDFDTRPWVLSSITAAEPYDRDWEQYIYEASRL